MKKTKVLGVVMALLLTATPAVSTTVGKPDMMGTTSITAEAAYSKGNYTVTVSAGVNVRTLPVLSSCVKGAAAYGKDCVITSVVGNWGYTPSIQCTNGTKSGWIYLPNMTKGWPFKIVRGPLRVRSSASTSSSILTSIPKNKVVCVTQTKTVGNQWWGYTKYNGRSGWICIYDNTGNYAYGISANGIS